MTKLPPNNLFVVAAQQECTQLAERKGDEEQHHRHRGRIPHLKADKGMVEQVGHQGMGGVIGAGHPGELHRDVKDGERGDDGVDGAEQELRLHHGQGHIKELLKTSQLVIGDLCVHINISEASYHRYTNFTSYMKTDIFIHACIFLKQYIESHHIPYTQEEKRLIKTLDLFQISSNSNLNCN